MSDAVHPYVPLCVPRWDEREALEQGAEYSEARGFYAPDPEFLDNVWAWLPLQWKQPGAALLPEMLPESTWEANLRTALPVDRWDAIRRHAYAAAGHRCEICGDRAPPALEAHERWTWDDFWCVQKLTGVIALCPLCHKGHHLGLARRLGLYPQVVHKLAQVNGWSTAQVAAKIAEAQAQADLRNRYGWTVDLSWLETGAYHLVYKLGGSR